jgi:hypothetical protein
MPNPTHAQEAQAFSARLRKALDRAGVRASPTVVAHEFNLRYYGRSVTVHTARNWLVGVSIPTQDKLQELAKWLEVEPNELRFGPSGKARTLREPTPLEGRLRHADFDMVERYLALPPDVQKTVREVVLGLSSAFTGQKPARKASR